MRAFLSFAVAFALASCTFEWDGQAPPFPLSGNPPSLSSFQKLNGDAPVGAASLLLGPDSVPWAEFCEFWDQGSGDTTRGCLKLHLSRLSRAGQAGVDEDWTADQLALLGDAEVLIAHDDMTSGTRTLTMHRPGDATSADLAFTTPFVGLAHVSSDAAGDAFAYLSEAAGTTQFQIYRRDPTFQRSEPLPDDSGERPIMHFTADGSELVVQGSSGHTLVYSSQDEGMVDLGILSSGGLLVSDLEAILEPTLAGVLVVPLDGSAQRTLSGGSSEDTALSYFDGQIYYADAQGLWRVPADGSQAGQLVQPGAQQLLELGPSMRILYSHDSATKYANGASDGWIGDRQLMQRGIFPAFSADGSLLYFLEHAANLGDYGDLTAIGVASGAPETLSLNCFDYGILPDGRLLSVEDAAETGTFNRLVVIDYAAQTKFWVTPSVYDFLLTPDASTIVADIVSGASGYDILRVPTPPPR